MADYTTEIKGRTLEYIDETHTYLVDGETVPSITTLLKSYGDKYRFVDRETLRRAQEAGTAVHEAIERYCQDGTEADLIELRGFKWLQKRYGFEVLENEVPVILFRDGKPISAGRLDMVLRWDGKIGGADIKRTSTLDKEYVAYQLNLYRIAYAQCYGTKWDFLRAIHLHGNTRKFTPIPINERMAWAKAEEQTEAHE